MKAPTTHTHDIHFSSNNIVINPPPNVINPPPNFYIVEWFGNLAIKEKSE
jgi:hypothetical protein